MNKKCVMGNNKNTILFTDIKKQTEIAFTTDFEVSPLREILRLRFASLRMTAK